jgi:uncharacterized membrane-anchored protein
MRSAARCMISFLAYGVGLALAAAAPAQPIPRSPRDGLNTETRVVGPEQGMARARKDAQRGPAQIRLQDAALHLPSGMSFVPREAARYLLSMTGQGPTPETVGIVFPDADWDRWHAVVEHHPVGYVSDADATWNADALMARVRESNARSNEQLARAEPGMRTEVMGWIEPPLYSREHRTLAWALAFRAPSAGREHFNYVVYNLGRGGYFRWHVRSRAGTMAAHRDDVRRLWHAIQFDAGHRHADHRPGDRAAPIKLRELLPG